jgi:TetR/AcrR family transcriptional repressor of mexJK operon
MPTTASKTADGKATKFVPKRGRPTSSQLEAIGASILITAKDLFLSQGYAATSMESVAASAGVSKGTLYARYQTKAELFHAVVADRLKAWTQGSDLVGDFTDISQRLFDRATSILEAMQMEEVQAFDHLLMSEAPRFAEIGRATYDLGYHQHIQAIAGEISSAGRSNGEPVRDSTTVALAFQNSLTGWMRSELMVRKPSRDECRAYASRIVELVMGGRNSW